MKLAKWMFFHYREFLKHPEYRGPNFTWFTPALLAYHRWRVMP